MKIVVFGKTGQVARVLAQYPDVICLIRSAADLTQPEQCAKMIRQYRPDAVINAAAYTQVDGAETEEVLATVLNADAPTAMAAACAAIGVGFVHISTDYVFDGTGTSAMLPEHQSQPLGAYGRSKRHGESGVIAAGGRYVILRTSWAFSSHGTNFLKTMLRLYQTRDALNIVSDQIGGPTPAAAIAAACHAIVHALVTGTGASGIYHFSGRPDVSWASFAAEIFAQSGRKVAITAIATKDYTTPAKRPLNSRLNCNSLQQALGIQRPDWRSGLADLCKEIEVM